MGDGVIAAGASAGHFLFLARYGADSRFRPGGGGVAGRSPGPGPVLLNDRRASGRCTGHGGDQFLGQAMMGEMRVRASMKLRRLPAARPAAEQAEPAAAAGAFMNGRLRPVSRHARSWPLAVRVGCAELCPGIEDRDQLFEGQFHGRHASAGVLGQGKQFLGQLVVPLLGQLLRRRRNIASDLVLRRFVDFAVVDAAPQEIANPVHRLFCPVGRVVLGDVLCLLFFQFGQQPRQHFTGRASRVRTDPAWARLSRL